MKTHLDPVKLARFVRHECGKHGWALRDALGERGARAIHRWQFETVGTIPYVGLPDVLLTELEIHEWELPDELWADPPVCQQCGKKMCDAKKFRMYCSDRCRWQTRKAREKTTRKALVGLRQDGDQLVREAA